MSLTVNRVIISGNLTRDPELRHVGEKPVANVGIAVNRTTKAPDGTRREEVCYLDIEAWGKTAELAGTYLKKGSLVLVEGRLKQDQWEDKDGNKRSKIKIVADSLHFVPTGKQTNPAEEETATLPLAGLPPAAVDLNEPPF